MNSIEVVPIGGIVYDIRKIVTNYFPPPHDAAYSKMPEAGFRNIVALAQDHLNEMGAARRLALTLIEPLISYIGHGEIMFQNSLYLRAARPGTPDDVVSWHRESFYGAPPETVNLWVPILNVTYGNTLRYIPGSAGIPDADISTVGEDSTSVLRGSAGHRIGLLYAPKRIVGGVDFDTAQAMEVPDGSAVLFPGQLVHGAALNLTDYIRFSVDLRLIAKQYAGNAKPGYFVEL